MKPGYHLIGTLAASSVIYFVFRSLPCLIISFISGFLIDLDHLLDYYSQEGLGLNFRRFYQWCNEHKLKFTILIFHSLELLFLLWWAIYFFKLGQFWISLAIGFSQHMLFDVVFNRNDIKTPYFYFITARALKGFRLRDFIISDK